jgi:RNA polymerase sigma-70 factor (ECF subfamily)
VKVGPLSVNGGSGDEPRLTGGNQYDALYRVHRDRVLRLCRLLLADPDEAEDVRQDVFMKLLAARPRGDDGVRWAAWLTLVTVNACRDRRRAGWWRWWRRSGLTLDEDGIASRDQTPEDALLSREQRRAIFAAFRRLPHRQREVFLLRHLEGWSTRETAEALGIDPGTVKRHLFRAVHALRRTLRRDP